MSPFLRASALAAMLGTTGFAAAQTSPFLGAGASCLAGDCQNGQGTVRTATGDEYSGPWAGGRFVDASYQVRYAGLPDATHAVSFSGASQRPLEGTFVRGNRNDKLYGTSQFTGKMGSVFSPFANAELSTYASGRYTDNQGLVYDGEFQYIPVRLYKTNIVYGVMIFMGARIDKEGDEVREGLFISEPFGAGNNILFRRARPDYITQLQSEYAMQQSQATQDTAQAQADAEGRRAAFGLFLNVLSGVGGMGKIGGGIGGGGGNALQRSALGMLSGAMTGKQSPDNAMAGLLGALQGGSNGNLLLNGKSLQSMAKGDVQSVLGEMGKQMVRKSLKEYEQSLREAGAGTPK